MSKKSGSVAKLIAAFEGRELDAHYLAYFECFNRQLYYEAHDVLEAVWLPARRTADGDFFKGLIQLAGAFVHLQKGRLKPADALFRLAHANLTRYGDVHAHLDVASVRRLIQTWRGWLAEGGYSVNPLARRPPPRLQVADA